MKDGSRGSSAASSWGSSGLCSSFQFPILGRSSQQMGEDVGTIFSATVGVGAENRNNRGGLEMAEQRAIVSSELSAVSDKAIISLETTVLAEQMAVQGLCEVAALRL